MVNSFWRLLNGPLVYCLSPELGNFLPPPPSLWTSYVYAPKYKEEKHIAVILIVLSAGFVACQILKIFPNLHEQVSDSVRIKRAKYTVRCICSDTWVYSAIHPLGRNVLLRLLV